MRALVTGGNGFLGSHLVAALLERGDSVTVLERSSSDTSRISGILPRISFFSLDEGGLDRTFDGADRFDLVFHTAVSYGREGETALEVFEANTLFALCVLESAVKYRAAVFVNMDTSMPDSLNAYTLSKKQFVRWGRYFANKKAIRFLNVELEHFYGSGDGGSKFTTYVIRSLVENVPEIALTQGEQKRDFIYIDDAVSAILLLADEVHAAGSRAGEHFFNCPVGSGKAVSIRKFAELVKRITGSETELKFGALPYRENEVMFSEADTTTLREVGWAPAFILEEGVRKMVEAEKEHLRGLDP